MDSLDIEINAPNTEVSNKFSSKTWNIIEQLVSPQEKAVYNSITNASKLLTHGSSKNDSQNTEKIYMYVLTDIFYKRIRKILVENLLVENTNDENIQKELILTDEEYNIIFSKKIAKKKSNNKTSMTADEIKINNTYQKIKLYIADLMSSYDNLNQKLQEPNYNFGFNSKYIEIIGLTFIYMSNFFVRNSKKYLDEKYFETILSVIISMNRFIENCSKFIGINPVIPEKTMLISQIFVNDINKSYDILLKVFPFDGIKVCKYSPALLISSPFDKYVITSTYKPRDHQVKIINEVFNNFDTGFFLIYNAMINSGKTTSIIGLANISKHFNKQLLCVCNIDTVRIQMANLCYNNEIKFAIGSLRDDKTVKITHHWTTKDNISNVVICSPEVAIKILNDDTKNSYIVFHDEPTAGSDTISKNLYDNVNVLLNSPKWIIFSSATSPTLHELEPLINLFKQKYGANLYVNTIYSPTVNVSCHVRTFEGNLTMPFSNCKNKEDLLCVIQKIKDIPFIGRLLSPFVCLNLYKNLELHKIKNTPNIPNLFKDVKNMKTDRIREIILEMLLLLTQENNETIQKICSYEIDEKEEKLNINDLGLSKWECMTLITTNNPISYVLGKFIEVEEECEIYQEEILHTFEYILEKKIYELKSNTKTYLEIYSESFDELNILENKLSLRKLFTKKIISQPKLIYELKNNEELENIKRKLRLIYNNNFEIKKIKNITNNNKDKIIKNVFKEGSMSNLLKSIKDDGIKNTKSIMDIYKKEYTQWLLYKEKKEKEIGEKSKQSTLTEYERGLEERKINENKPKYKFPKHFQIGTEEFNKKFETNCDFFRDYNDIGKIIEKNNDISVPDELLLLLFCGIGIYSPSNKLVNETYTSIVIELATQGKLAYVISDNNISYGTNYPFGKVIILDDFVNSHSVNTLFQLMGRAGRVGKLAKASACVSENTKNIILDYVINPAKYAIEANNINNIVKNYKIDTSIQDEIKKMEDELRNKYVFSEESKIEDINISVEDDELLENWDI